MDFSDLPLRFDGVLRFPPFVSARGGGAISFSPTSKWVFGNGRDRRAFKSQVQGIRFLRTLASANGAAIPRGSSFIEIDGCRELLINDCFFYGAEVAISHPANSALPDHSNAMIVISNNHFGEVDYAWKASRHEDAPWGVNSDCVFSGNIVNRAYESHVHCDSIDGVTVTDNTFFFLTHNQNREGGSPRVLEKKNNIYIGESNWVHIHNNNCFEAGTEAIKLSAARTANITGNNIAWPGQVVPSDGIHISGHETGESLRLVATSNQITYYTRHAIYVEGAAQACSVGLNSVIYDDHPPTYLGAEPLGVGTAHNRYHFADSVGIMPIVDDGFSPRAGEGDRYPSTAGVGLATFSRLEKFAGSSTAQSTASFSPGGSAPTFTCRDVERAGKEYGALVVITAKRRAVTDARSSTYILMVSKASSDSGPVETVVLISSGGWIKGESTEDPSFTWALVNDVLVASSVGATKGIGFVFFATATGNLLIS
ncbi:hypothetical protein GCM10017602_01050 [Herbiconiux flava]|nr:hypothetical protein GCM10017602_01050 [Herbiconiux flava]